MSVLIYYHTFDSTFSQIDDYGIICIIQITGFPTPRAYWYRNAECPSYRAWAPHSIYRAAHTFWVF